MLVVTFPSIRRFCRERFDGDIAHRGLGVTMPSAFAGGNHTTWRVGFFIGTALGLTQPSRVTISV